MKKLNFKNYGGGQILFLPLLVVFLTISAFTSAWGQSPSDFTFTTVNGFSDLFQFTGTYDGCVEYEEWTLGDGTLLEDVSDPLHLYLQAGTSTVTSYTVTHTVQVNGVTTSTSHVITVIFMNAPSEYCTSRYFSYDVDGCTLTLNSTLASITPTPFDIDVSISFGDDSPPYTGGVNTTHSFLNPGTYYVTQTYIIYNEDGSILAQGECTRPVTVGCCCSVDPIVSVDFNFEACSAFNVTVNADVCCNSNHLPIKCQILQVKVGTNPWKDLTCESKTFCITNYSTYLAGLDGKIQVEYKSFCHGQPITKYIVTQPPIEGVFIGLDPTQPYNCAPTNTTGISSVNEVANPAGGGSGSNGCLGYYSLLSQYSVLTGFNYQGLSNLQRHVYVHPNSIIQVDKPFSFINNIAIHMGSNSGWTVLNNANSSNGNTFELRSKISMTGGCCLWRGINVMGNGRFRTQNAGTNTDLDPNNDVYNIIQDAVFAVRPISINFRTPTLAMRDTKFRNNFISVLANRGAFVLSGSIANPYFVKNEFSSEKLYCIPECFKEEVQAILPPGVDYLSDISYAGFYIDGTQPVFSQGQVPLTNVTFIPTPDGDHNVFNNLALGIDCKNTNLSIKDVAQFSNIGVNPYGPTTGIALRFKDVTGNRSFTQQGLVDNGTTQQNLASFDNCRIGINALSLQPGNPSTLNIADNLMNKVAAGVVTNFTYGSSTGEVSGDWNGKIQHNTINAKLQGVAIYDIAPTTSSLLVKDNTIDIAHPSGWAIAVIGDNTNGNLQADIDDNHITTLGGGVNIATLNRGYIHANQVNGSGGKAYNFTQSRSEIECNDASGSSTVGMAITNTEILSDLSFNNFSNTGTGMEINDVSPAENLIQCNTFTNNAMGLRYNNATTGDQVNTGNTWNGTGAEYIGGNISGSKYFVPLGGSPNPTIPGSGWFFEDPTLSAPPCSLLCTLGEKPPKEGKIDGIIADGSSSAPTWQQWQSDQYLIRKLLENPAITEGSETLNGYLSSKLNTTVGRLVNSRLQIPALYQQDPVAEATLSNNNDKISAKQTALNVIDETLDDALLLQPEQWAGMIDQRTVLSTDIATLQGQNTAILEQAKVVRNTEATNLRSLINTINASQVFEQNEKTVLDLLLQLTGNESPLTEVQLNTLKGIGEQCPHTGGTAVYWAASIYETCTGKPIVQENCAAGPGFDGEDTAERDAGHLSGGTSLKVFPNPTDGSFKVQLPEGMGNGQLIITDLMGKVVYQTKLYQSISSIALPDIAKGVYSLTVTGSEHALAPVKLVIQH